MIIGKAWKCRVWPRLGQVGLLAILSAALATALASSSAWAKTPAPKKVQAPTFAEEQKALAGAIKAGDWQQASRQAARLEQKLGELAPLEIVDLQILASPPQGLGMYQPLTGGKAYVDEVFIYAHVRNHGHRRIGDFWQLHLSSDLRILDAKGKALAEEKNFGQSQYSARVAHRDTMVVIALRIKGLDPGAYTLELGLHDRISKKKTQGRVPFIVP